LQGHILNIAGAAFLIAGKMLPKNQIKEMEKKNGSWRFSVARCEKGKGKNCQICMCDLFCIAKHLEG
jgi:hypothetical protein